jgi:hypothetical protein
VRVVTGPDVVTWVHVQLHRFCPDKNLARGLGFVLDGRLVAGVTYCNWNGYDVQMSMAVNPGFQWSRRALAAIFGYPFLQLKLNRVTALVESDNVDSQRFVKRLGGTLEAKLAEACHSGDLLVYRMLRSECRWLRDRNDQPVFRSETARYA